MTIAGTGDAHLVRHAVTAGMTDGMIAGTIAGTTGTDETETTVGVIDITRGAASAAPLHIYVEINGEKAQHPTKVFCFGGMLVG